MRRVLSLLLFCAVGACAGLAHAQGVDLAVGGNTVWSFKPTTASTGFLPPPEKGGMYPSATLQLRLRKHLGVSAEGAFRYHRGIYNAFQPYRPMFFDLNALYSNRFTPKINADFMAGIGAETLLFYTDTSNCNLGGGGCTAHINSNHFLLHFGGGVRYYFWRNFFARPEAHWYIIRNNVEFHSDNVFRAGVSVGYSWGSR